MTELQKKLVGQLIGLARATDGNEHLRSVCTGNLIREGLAAAGAEEENEPEIQQLMILVDAEKRRMVPDCFLCASPCGRTDAYDFTRMESEGPELFSMKQRLLDVSVCLSKASSPEGKEELLYKALIFLGMDGMEPAFLLPVVEELETSLL